MNDTGKEICASLIVIGLLSGFILWMCGGSLGCVLEAIVEGL